MPKRNVTWVILLAATALAVYLLKPSATVLAPGPSAAPPAGLERFYEARQAIGRSFIDPVDDRALSEGAIRGMVRALDPYGDYYTAEQAKAVEARTNGQYSGIGVELEVRENRLVVLSRADGSPAALAGILPGDVVVEINGADAELLNPDEAAHRLAGPPGTSVSLTVLRPGTLERLHKTLTRGVVETMTVRGWVRLPAGRWDWFADPAARIAYIRIQGFMPRTVEELRSAATEALRQGAAGIVLDVRFNPGGTFDSAIECADLFLTRGPIASRKGASAGTWHARAEGTLPPVPLVVLVNRFSASAAEVFAGALAGNRRALVVGERTWGKGTVQSMLPLSDGSVLKLTTGRWHLPDGTCLQRVATSERWGVTPAVESSLTTEQVATLLATRERIDAASLRDAWLRPLAATQPADLTGTHAPSTAPAAWTCELLACDPPLQAAIEAATVLSTQPTTQPGVLPEDFALPAPTTRPAGAGRLRPGR